LGIESARAAGIYTVGVNTGPLPDQVLWNAGANTVYLSMRQLADHIEQLIQGLN
jgi:phosphoglycolate phosphatase-like HAD superfamily hydrolase